MVTSLLYTLLPNFGSLSSFWRWKEHPCPLHPDLGVGRILEVLTGVFHLVLDTDAFTGLWCTHDPNFGSLSWFRRCKEHPCPLSHQLGLWRMLEVPDWGLASWSWFGYGQWSLIYLWSEFWLYLDFEGAKNIHVLWVLIWGFGGCWRFLIGVWHPDIDLDLVTGLW